MTKRTEELRVERKVNGKYECVNVITDHDAIHHSLENALLGKYLWKYPSIKRITDKPNYDGTRTITAYMNDGLGDYRYVFIIED